MGKHIMIIDDDQDAVETAKIRLEANGYQVSSTLGQQAVQDVVNCKPDLILLDVTMPAVDGFAIIRELKRNPAVSKVPVIVFSGKPKEAMIDLFGPEGISGYVSKPYPPGELLDQVRKVLGA